MENLTCCTQCNGVFIQENSEALCKNCFKNDQDILKQTQLYISNIENKSATLEDIVAATGAKNEQITRWIQEGELNISQLSNFLYECEVCQKATYEGRLCSSCMEAITQGV